MDTHQQYSPYHNDQRIVTPAKGLSSGLWWSRLSLRVLSLFCSAASIGFSAYYYTNWTLGPLLMMGPPATVSFIWSCVDIFILSATTRRQGVHPAACLILDLLLVLGLGAISGVLAFTLSKLDDSGYYFAFFQDEAGEEYLRIVLGFGIMGAIFHLAMLIMAVVQLKGRRASNTKVIYVQGQNNGSFPLSARQNPGFEDAPPAYSQPMDQRHVHELPDQISFTRATNLPEQKKNKDMTGESPL